MIFAENASFTCKLRRHLIASMALTTPKPQNTDTNGIHAPVGMTLLFAILTIIIIIYIQKRFVRKLQHIRPLLRAHILIINMRTYLGGCVRAGAYNLILIFAQYYYAPWTWTRERHVILKAALHSRLAVLLLLIT